MTTKIAMAIGLRLERIVLEPIGETDI